MQRVIITYWYNYLSGMKTTQEELKCVLSEFNKLSINKINKSFFYSSLLKFQNPKKVLKYKERNNFK